MMYEVYFQMYVIVFQSIVLMVVDYIDGMDGDFMMLYIFDQCVWCVEVYGLVVE